MCEGVFDIFKKTGDPAKDAENAQKIILASSGLKAMGDISGGAQAKKYFQYQQRQAEADAQAEAQLGEVRGNKIKKAGGYVRDAARAGYGASGVRADSGSALAVDEFIGKNAEEDALTELYTGKRRQAVKNTEAQGYGMQGNNAFNAGLGNASKSLLSGAAVSSEASDKVSKWIKRSERKDAP